jgi:hypothetical protein
VEDDQCRAHDIVIPDTPLCDALPHRLLSPQPWAQEMEKGSRKQLNKSKRPSCNTNADETTLTWGKGRFTKTIALDKHTNVAIMHTRPGIKKYTAFAASVKSLERDIQCFLASGTPESSPPAEVTDEESVATHDSRETSPASDTEDGPIANVDFEQQPEVANVSVERDVPLDNGKDELYRIHVRGGHLHLPR